MNDLEFEILVKRKLREKKISMSIMAKELNISVAYVSEILRGKRKANRIRNNIKNYLDI